MDNFDDTLWEKSLAEVEKLACRDWETDVIKEELSNGTIVYVARNLELERCIAQGDTPEEALAELKEATRVHLAASLQYKLPIPTPASTRQDARLSKKAI